MDHENPKFTDFLPKHVTLHIAHDPHKGVYESVQQYFRSKDECAHGPTDGFDESEWISRDDFKEAVAHDSLWEIQWYPNSPVGFCTAYGSTFENAMMCANQ